MKQEFPGHTAVEDPGNKIPFVRRDGHHINILFIDKIFKPLLHIHGFKQTTFNIVCAHAVEKVSPDSS